MAVDVAPLLGKTISEEEVTTESLVEGDDDELETWILEDELVTPAVKD